MGEAVDRHDDSALKAAEPASGDPVPPAETCVDFGPLKQNVGFMLRLAQLQVFEAFFAEFAPRGVRPGQIGVLVGIAENPGIRQGTLARALHIKRSNMAKIVRLLEAEGLIERLVPPSDRRAVELRLTRVGRGFVERALPDISRNDCCATGMLSERERATLMRLLHKLAGAHPMEARA
jgi:DNA-binding MarR family transcriptional regulator